MKLVYVPTTLAVWQRLVANGSMFKVSGTAFAVTANGLLIRLGSSRR